jgi:CheY-like chemotaxis protein
MTTTAYLTRSAISCRRQLRRGRRSKWTAALDLLRAGLRPCAIVLDLMMPVMDGWDFRANQLKDPELEDVPGVLVSATGFSSQSIRTQFGDLPYLRKPTDPDELVSTLKGMCRGWTGP